MKIAFTGGGTLGHIYPALAIIDYIRECDTSIDSIWIGRNNEIEKTLIENNNILFYGITCGKFRRYFSIKNIIDIFRIIIGYYQAKSILKKNRPDLIFSKGGFVSVPVVYAAHKLKIKIITHESDITLGLATKLNSRVASKILKGFALTDLEKSSSKYYYSGNPLRSDLNYFKAKDIKEIESSLQFNNLKYKDEVKTTYLNIQKNFDSNKEIILVVGGSLGALQINTLIKDNLELILSKYNIYHQMGEKTYQDNSKFGYICVRQIGKELGYLYKKASLVISRCGANTLNELIQFRKNILAIPLENKISRGEQVLNAEFYKKLNLLEVYKSEMNLMDVIENMLNNDNIEKRELAFSKFILKDANEEIYNQIREYKK